MSAHSRFVFGHVFVALAISTGARVVFHEGKLMQSGERVLFQMFLSDAVTCVTTITEFS